MQYNEHTHTSTQALCDVVGILQVSCFSDSLTFCFIFLQWHCLEYSIHYMHATLYTHTHTGMSTHAQTLAHTNMWGRGLWHNEKFGLFRGSVQGGGWHGKLCVCVFCWRSVRSHIQAGGRWIACMLTVEVHFKRFSLCSWLFISFPDPLCLCQLVCLPVSGLSIFHLALWYFLLPCLSFCLLS